MTTTTVTLTGDVTDAIATDFDARRTKAYVRYNTSKVVTDDGVIYLGGGGVNVASDGTFSLPNVVASTSLVENLQATVYVDYADPTLPQSQYRKTQAFGPYDLSGETGTVDISELEEVQALDPTFASVTMAQMQELLDAQILISGIDDTDSAVAGLIDNILVGPLTNDALADFINTLVPTASTTAQGKVELATNAEVVTGTDTARAVTAAGVKAAVRPTSAINLITNWFHVVDYGATGDGTTNDTTAVQAAIDAAYAAGGGVVFVVPKAIYRVNALVLKDNVHLINLSGTLPYTPTAGLRSTVFKSNGSGHVITDNGTSVSNASIVGIAIDGNTTAARGIYFHSATRVCIDKFGVHNTLDEGVKVDAGVASRFTYGLITNALLTRSRAAVCGAFDINGTDHWIENVESTCSQSAGEATADSSERLAAIVIRGTNIWLINSVGEISTIGIYIATGSKYTTAIGSRADRNFGHGWVNNGNRGNFAGCKSLTNGSLTANTYSGFKTTVGGNAYSGCTAHQDTGTIKYGFEDTVNGGMRNTYDASCWASSASGGTGPGTGAGWATAEFIVNTSAGSARTVPNLQIRPTGNPTTVDVNGVSFVVLTGYSSATTITDFTGGVMGQEIKLLGDADVTIDDGALIKTNTGADKTLAANKIYRFTRWNDVWYEDA